MGREARIGGRVLLLALTAAVLAGCQSADVQSQSAILPDETPVPSPVASAVASSPRPPSVRIDTLTGVSQPPDGPGSYRYRVDVPQLEGAGIGQAVDPVIKARLQRDVDGFVDRARGRPAGPAPSELTCTSRTVRLAARLAVLRVDCSDRLAGTDRPDATVRSFNCDLVAGRVLSLQDLFSAGSGYLDVLSAAARTQLRSRLPAGDGRTQDDGTAPIADNFRAFLLDRSALVVVLPSRYRPEGAPGPPEVSVPYSDLHRYLERGVQDLLSG